MSVLRKPYELSIWGDTWNSDTGRFDEEKLVVIGSNTMTSQSRALSPKLVENVNGTHTLSFMIYYQYKDNITGEDIENPYAPYLTNERKLKLNYDGKWYNFIIKSVKEDSSKHSYEISAIDQYINELSKNGFNLTLDAELNNNVGSVQSLAQKSLEATDWVVPDAMVDGSEFIPDKANETLVKLKVTQSFIAAHILDGDDITPGTAPDDSHTTTITANTIIYAFYSCLMDEAPRFQFICGAEPFTKNDERVITTSSCQYYAINDMTYSTPVLGMPIPTVCSNDISDVVISDDYRGARYIFSPNTQYNTILGRYVSIYTKDGVEYYGYSTTDFKAPNLIQNWVTNPNTFKSTSGWHAGTTSSGATSSARGEIKNIAVRNTDSSRKLIDDLESGDFQSWVAEENHHYIPKLDYTAPATLTNLGVIINTGFYDNRTAIKNLINGQKFMCRIKGSNTLANKSIALRLGTVDNERYTLTTYLTDSSITIPSSLDSEGYYVVQLTIQNSEFTEKEYKKQDNGRVYIVINGSAAVQIEDFQIFEKVDTDEGYMRPEDQLVEAKVVTTYYLYDKEAVDNLDAASAIEDLNPAYKSTIDPRLSYDLPLSCEKRRAISVKESNYFNVIQTLCETFECWADFIIGHDADGAITSKQIVFKNYIGSQNWAGFRYGVNLKSVSRTDDSKAIVTKLVVKQNSNEFGTNGFCTIARAPSNESGENHIYNVDYYINQGLLSIDDWNDYVYGSNGYFTQLRILNLDLKGKNEIAIKQAIVLAQAQADLTTAEAGYAAVIDQYEEACAAFRKLCGYDYDNPDWTQIPSVRALVTDSKNIKYLTNCGEYYQARYDFNQKKVLAKARYNDLKLEYDYLYKDQASLNPDPDRVHFDGINELNRKKELLHKAFYEKFYRFIQEGTWNNEEYYDDEKYYLDALSTLYTSSVPKVSYNISVLELSQLQGYTDFTFAVGDRTYVEDPEFFGYDDNGAPIREEVVLSEITYNLDEPDKNSIKVQNFKTQFQDLFKKIAATVQSVQFSTGAYNKAAQLADANDTKKSSYLQGALNDASTILQNLAEQTVRLDSEGLTITDGAESNRKLRAVSGGILLTEDGGNTWNVGITASGVSAKILTTGTLNTGVVNIMYGDEPTFRWDAFGITAYDFANNNPMLPILDTGVRFDRLGVYGFTGAPGDWHPDHVVTWETSTDTHEPPKAANGIREHSIFEVTKEGLYLDIGKGRSTYGHGRTRTVTTNNDVTTVDYTYDAITQVIHNTIASLGKVEDVVYNKWDNSNPYYTLTEQNTVNPFVKVMSVGYKVPGTNQESENFALYDDGTVRARKILVREGIGYDDGSGLVKIAYGVNSTLPADGTTWSGLDNTTGNWHKVRQANDNYIATTYDNGAHWFGPTHIADKEIVSTTQEYLITNSGITPLDNDPNWSATMPSTAGQFGKVLWVKIIAQRADGTSFVLQKLPLAIPEEVSDFNISADHNVIIVDKKQNLNTSTVVCTATSGWDTYTWTVPAGVTYNAVANILTLSLDYGTVIAHQSITITCQGEKNGYTSAIDNVTIATVFDGTDGWTIINTNPTFTYTADFTGHAKTTTPANPQTETTTIEVYHGGTKIGNYDAGHSDTTKYYFKVASISNTNYLEFSRTNNASSCVISGSIVSGNPSVADNSIELSIAIYKGSELQSDLTKNTRLSWVFVYDGAPGPEGASGVSPYTMELTNDSIQIGADYDGSGAVFGGQVIGIQVSQGTTLQSSWGITAAQCYYVDGTLITPQPAIVSSVTGTQTEVTLISGAAWPTAVTTDSFILRITASNGTLTLIKDATIKRLYNGQPGTWYHLQCEITTLPRLTKNPSTFGITTFKVAGYKYVGNVKSSASDKYIAYTINSGITWTRVNEAGSKTFSTSSLNLSDSTTNIGFALIEADGVVNYSLDPAKTLDGPEFISVVDNGSSPYSIALSEDFCTIGVDPDATGEQTIPNQSTELQVYFGNTVLTPIPSTGTLENSLQYKFGTSHDSTGRYLEYNCNNIVLASSPIIVIGTNKLQFIINKFTMERGTISFIFYEEGSIVATTVYEIFGNEKGQPGEVWDIEFPNGDTIVQNNDNTFPATVIRAHAYRRATGGSATDQSVNWSLNGTALSGSGANIYFKIDAGAWKYNYTGTGTLWDTVGTVQLGSNILTATLNSSPFDKETITIVPHGDNGENGDPGEHGTDSDTQFIYMRRASTSPIPDPKTDVWVTATANSATEGTAGTWYITNLDAVSSYRRVYRAQQTKTVTYVNNVPQTPTITCTQPEVYKAWHDDETGAAHVDQIAYATFIRTTNNGKTDALYFSNGTDGATAGRLYINAAYIKTGALDAGLITTGTLMVTDGTNTVFSANVNSGAVQIGGFQVDYNALWYTGSTTNTAFTYSKFFICSEGTSTNWTVGGSGSTNGWVLLVRNGNSGSGVFGIKNTGAMYATSGEIGTWSIGPTSLYTSSGSYVYLSGGGNFTANKKSPIAQAMNQYDASSTTTVVSDLCMRIGSDASNAVFGIGTDGKIYATAGYLGGWQVDPAGLYAAAKDIIENEQWEYFKTYSHLQPGTGLWKLNLTTVEKNTLQTYFGITTNSTLYTGVSDFAPALGTLAIFTGSEQGPDAFMSRNYITALAHILCRYAQSSFARQTTENANGCRIYSSQTTSMGNLQYGIGGGTVIDVLGNVNIVNRIISCRGSSSNSSSTGIRFCTNGEGETGGDNNRPTYYIMCSGFRRAGRTSGSHDAVSWSQFWSQIDNWASDRNKKQNITALANLPAYDLLFDALQPCRYQYKNGNSGRYHTGFIAQDIVQSLTDVGLTMQDLAAVCYDDTDPEDSYWFLRRDELIALNIDQTQRLKTRVSQLESRVHELEVLLNEN